MTKKMISQAYKQVFGDQLIAEAARLKVNKVKKQSTKRMGTGTTNTGRQDLEFNGKASEDPFVVEQAERMMRQAREG